MIAVLIRTEVLYSKSAIATQILLSCEGKSVLVDAGDGVLRDLTVRHFQFGNLLAVLITHEHSDHTGGLFSLLHFMKHFSRREPLQILVPKPAVYLGNLVKRPLMYSDLGFEVFVNEIHGGKTVKVGPFTIKSFRTNHVDFHSMGYSVSDRSGFRVVISGDTMPSLTLKERVRGADLAVLESTFRDGQEEYAHHYGHMTVGQAKDIGELAKHLLLVHQMPQGYFKRMTCATINLGTDSQEGRTSS